MKDDKKYNLSIDEPQLPSQLKDAKRNHGGMTVPEDFFAQFERKMNAVIDADVAAHKAIEPKVSAPKPTVFDWRRWTSIAAAVVVVVALSVAVRSNRTGETPADTQQSIMLASMAENEVETVDFAEQMEDDMMVAVSDYDVFDLYCDL